MKRKRYLSNLHRLVDKALASGAVRESAFRVRWDVAGRCERPYLTEIYARPTGDEHLRKVNNARRHVVVRRFALHPMQLDLLTPCRECETCKNSRARLWTARALDETRLAYRTWFGTLTVAPEHWFKALNECRLQEASQGVDFDTLPLPEQHALMHARLGKEVTKMLKRIRALVPPYAVRHLVVLELTKAGVIHYHVLLHETFSAHPVRHRQLANQWPLGFSKWNLVDDPRRASYVAKYLSKSLLARVRASEGYGKGGQTPLGIAAPSVSNGAGVAREPF